MHVDAQLSQASQPCTLIRNAALILTMDPLVGAGELGIIEGADLLLIGDKIVAIGEHLQADGGQIIDATGKIVLPGFVDVHDHLWQSLIRGCKADQDLNGWLDACVFPLADPAITPSETEIYAAVRLSALGLVMTGVTTVVDWSHGFSPAFVRGNMHALDESGLRFVFAYRGTANPAVIDDITRVKKELIDPNPRASFQIASHPGTASRFLPHLQAMSRLAKDLGVKLHVHLLENIVQRQDEPVQGLVLADALGPDLLGAHAIHLLDEEISFLAQRDVRVAHNPLSNMRLASGIIRLPALHRAGVKVGLGLDGGTNDTSDMFNTMRVAIGLQRATSLQARVFPTVSEVLRMATLGGAEVLDMAARIGSLTPGKQADVVILDPRGVNFAPRLDWINQIVFNGQPANVDWVFVHGRPLKAGGRMVGADSTAIVQAAEEAARRLRNALHVPLPRSAGNRCGSWDCSCLVAAPRRSMSQAGGTCMPEKRASTDYPIHELLAERWSPYAFQDRPVPNDDLCSLFEAARWAASSFNEQPWTYIVGTQEHPDQFQQVLSCLIEFNQVWAKVAPVLALGVVSLIFARNGQVNRAAVHDLGLAAGNLLVEATARGLVVHQMLGILPDKARQIFDIPEGFEAWTAIAIGYRGEPTGLPDALKERERLPRQRKPLSQFVFSGKWGSPSPLVLKE